MAWLAVDKDGTEVLHDLEQISETYQSPCKELTGINNTIYYLKTIEEKIN